MFNLVPGEKAYFISPMSTVEATVKRINVKTVTVVFPDDFDNRNNQSNKIVKNGLSYLIKGFNEYYNLKLVSKDRYDSVVFTRGIKLKFREAIKNIDYNKVSISNKVKILKILDSK